MEMSPSGGSDDSPSTPGRSNLSVMRLSPDQHSDQVSSSSSSHSGETYATTATATTTTTTTTSTDFTTQDEQSSILPTNNMRGHHHHDSSTPNNGHNSTKRSQLHEAMTQLQANHPNTGATKPTPHSTKHLLTLILFLAGLLVCVTSTICIILLPSIVTNQIAKRLVLKNNSMLLERWSKPNVPMYFKVWLYDVKNAQEIIDKRDTKPRVNEIGPFVFNLRRQKDVISFAGENLYYTERKIYHFNRELSCCAIDTTVTIPNIPLVAVVDRALSYNLPLLGRFIPRLINRAIQSLREQLFVRRQVREILFEGYDVELLRVVSRIGSLVGLPQQSQRFALLKGRNDTWRPEQDGVWAINTGQRDRRQFGRVSSWNSYKRLPFWPAPQCNVINGSDGTLFPPPIKPTEPLYIFNQELCRTVNLVYDRPSDVRSIKALRFVLNPLNFAHTMTSGGGGGGGGGGDGGQQSNSSPPLLTGTVGGQSAGRTRINPTFQNPQASPPPMALAPIQTLGPLSANPSLARASRPQPQSQAASPRGASGRTTGTSELMPSASEQSSNFRMTQQALPASRSQQPPPDANLLADQPQDRKESEEAKIRAQQEKLIRAAQKVQLANERTSLNPQTCFCDRQTTNLNGVNVCEFDGLIDLSKCSKQAQVIFGSMPHFYNSDPRLLRQVAGLEPNASKHTTYLDIEPNTGLVLGGKRRVQLNLIIKHNNEIDGFEKINDMLVPVVWFEESAMIPEEAAQKFRSIYVQRIRLINMVLFSLLIASIAVLVIDARLLMDTRYWPTFKLLKLSHLSPGGTLVAAHESSDDSAGGSYKRRPGEPRKEAARSQKRRVGPGRSLRLASTPLVVQLGASKQQKGSGGAQLPLLNSPSSGATTTVEDSSPELRKWSPNGSQTTRIHLSRGDTSATLEGQKIN